MNELSVLDLIGQLCDLHLGPTQRAYRVQPSISRTEAKKKLKKKAYDALFSYLGNRPPVDENLDSKRSKDFEGILLEIYKLRTQHKHEEADRLEYLFNHLQKDDRADSRLYIRFLVALKGSAVESCSAQLGEDVFKFPLAEEKKKNMDLVPVVPVCYGDMQHLSGFSQFYMHYPREIFEKPFVHIANETENCVFTAFDSTPGKNIGPDSIFTTKFLLGDSHEQSTQESLFGGLMQGRVKGLELQLALPELPSSDCQIRIPEFKGRSSPSSSRLSEESGLGSGTISLSSSVITFHDVGYDDSIWEKALTEPRSHHYTWEWIGYQPGPTERPYLTEGGPKVYDVLIQLRKRVSAILCPEVQPAKFITVQPQVLVKHILLMLIGVPSKLFPFHKDTYSFGVVDGLHISGTSPDMLASFLSEFTYCGTFYSRLAYFSSPPVLNSFYTGGLVFQAFTSAIRKVLSHFTAAVLNIPKNLSLLKLKVYLLQAMDQLRYLANLCHCHDKAPPTVLPGEFPTGMKLLSYLYNEAESSTSSSHYPLLLSILQTSFAPFMLFIRDWVFLGVHRDYYGEFMIQVDTSCVESREETYWSHAYNLMTEKHNQERVPSFLREIVHDIVTCGKAINLLRICNPQHFMCNVSESDTPTVTITFSQDDLRAMERYCQTYVGRMRQITQQISDDREEVLRKMEQQKFELQQMARRTAEKEIARLQGIIDERKKKAAEKKRVEFARLKEQMESDLKRRAGEKEEEKEVDKQFIARLNREEEALSEQEIELEKKARDDLIAYYTELGEEALHRERLAMWRVRRAQLDNARFLFLQADAERWRKEWQQQLEAKDVVDAESGLPHWAERHSEDDPPLVVSGQEDVYMPAWAQRIAADSETDDEAVDDDKNVTLPSWVRRNLPEGTTIEVVDDLKDNEEDGDSNIDEDQDIGSQYATNAVKSSRTYNAVQIGGAALPRPHIKTSAETHSSVETDPVETKPHLHKVEGKSATDESEESSEAKSTIRMVDGMNALTETVESQAVPHIKSSSVMCATKESEPSSTEHRPHLKFREGVKVNEQSSEERQIIPKRHRDVNSQNIASETQPQVWVIKKPSMFGHVSQLSNSDYILTVPKLRRQSVQHANVESDFKDFAIKPHIRMSKTMSATKESDTTSAPPEYKPHIRVLSHRNASVESQQVDENALIIKRFQARNVRGHASDSTVQRLLYGIVEHGPEDETDGTVQKIDIGPGQPYQLEQYSTEFGELTDEPSLDLLSHIFVADLGRDLVDTAVTSEEEVEAYKYTPLSVLLTRSIIAPVRAQISLVNNAVINYFTNELKIDDHFEAIRRYLLMADGDFAEILANILLEKLSTNPLPQEVLNPVFLNGALNKAIRSSIHSDDENAQHLNFALKYMPSVLMPNAPNSLKCLQLKYNVKWPLSVILTNSCMEKYHLVFNFLLQIKRVVWTLKDIWHRLKRDALVNKVGHCSQFRHLQLHRQEMEHFVKTMQGYITNQVIHVSWQEFQTNLSQPIAGLDQLQALHERYVDNAIARCLLNAKAERVMKIIQDIFCLILKFRSQLVSAAWTQNSETGEVIHPNFANMANTYKSFHVYSFFLFKVVNRLSQKGYQPHLQDLLLQLNFNDYYTEAAN